MSGTGDTHNRSPGRLSLSQFIAFNDELAAMLRAGVPLDTGLRDLGQDVSGKVGRVSLQIAERVERGESLDRAIADEKSHFPPAYAALLQAGLRSGRLGDVLTTLSRVGRRSLAIRQAITLAAIYPLIVVLLAWGLLLGVLVWPLTGIVRTYEWGFLRVPAELAGLLALIQNLQQWWWALPAALGVLVLWWWSTGWAKRWEIPAPVRWLPGVRGISSRSNLASLLELLAVLVEQEVPLPEAIRLCAATTSDRQWVDTWKQLADDIERGELTEESPSLCQFPAMARWALATRLVAASLGAQLRSAAEVLDRGAARQATVLAGWLPIVTGVLIAGMCVLIYALALILPLRRLFLDLVT